MRRLTAALFTMPAMLLLLLLPPAAAQQRAEADGILFEVRFASSVRGLEAGADVEVRGIAVGTVTATSLHFDQAANDFLVEVSLTLDPGRFPLIGARSGGAEETYAKMDALVRKGLRARLASQSLIGGPLAIELAMMPDEPPATLQRDGGVPVIPAGPSRTEAVLEAAQDALRQLAKAPIERSLQDLQAAAAALRAFAEGPELHEALANLSASTEQLQTFLQRLDGRLDRLTASADGTLDTASQTLRSVQYSLGDRSPILAELQRVLRETAGAARALRLFAEYLERYPNALITGKRG